MVTNAIKDSFRYCYRFLGIKRKRKDYFLVSTTKAHTAPYIIYASDEAMVQIGRETLVNSSAKDPGIGRVQIPVESESHEHIEIGPDYPI